MDKYFRENLGSRFLKSRNLIYYNNPSSLASTVLTVEFFGYVAPVTITASISMPSFEMTAETQLINSSVIELPTPLITSSVKEPIKFNPASNIEFVGFASGVDNAALPPHETGDLILVIAYCGTSATAPTLPSGFEQLYSGGSNFNSHIIGYRFATSNSEISNTWVGATGIAISIYRNVNPITPIGAFSSVTATTSPLPYPSLTINGSSGKSWVAALVGIRINTGEPNIAPPGMINRGSFISGTSTAIGIHDTNRGVLYWSGGDGGIGSPRWRLTTLELLPTTSSANPVILPVPNVTATIEPIVKASATTVALSTFIYSGNTEVISKVSASVDIPKPNINGLAEVITKATTIISLVVPSVSSSIDALINSTSAVALPTPQVSSQTDLLSKITGALVFSVPAVSSVLEAITKVSATVNFPTPVIYGEMAALSGTNTVNATIALSTPNLSSNIKSLTKMTAVISLPLIPISSIIKLLTKTSASIIVPKPSISSNTEVITKSNTSMVLPTPSLIGNIKAITKAVGNLALYVPGVNVLMKLVTKIAGTLNFQQPVISSQVLVKNKLTGNINLPFPIISANIHVPVKVYSSLELPAPDIISTIESLSYVYGYAELPTPVTAASIKVRTKINATIPFYVPIVNGVIEQTSFFYGHLNGVGGIEWPPYLEVENAVSPATREHNRLTEQDRFTIGKISQKTSVFVKANRE